MAEEQEKSSKTEEPTTKRLSEARERGQVSKSQEVNHWMAILALTLLVLVFIIPMMRDLAVTLSGFFAHSDSFLTDQQAAKSLMGEAAEKTGWILALPFGIVIIMAVASNILQTGFLFATQQLKPQLQRISPVAGFKRLFSARSLVEFTKGIVKISLVGAVATMVVMPEMKTIASHMYGSLPDALTFLRSEALKVLVAVLFVMIIIAVIDLAFQRWDYLQSLRMTRQEVKDEFKQTEGDPLIKARLRQLRAQRARQRIAQAVPRADVVVTNPTHYAVALEYDEGVSVAPKVTAKGIELLARRIRELAEQHDVPIVENPPLARALYDEVELDQEVPPQHYQAVAEIISYVMRLRSWRSPRVKPSRGKPIM